MDIRKKHKWWYIISEKKSLCEEWTVLVFRLDYPLSRTHLILHLELVIGRDNIPEYAVTWKYVLEIATISSST